MAYKVNYGLERAERNRTKQAKKAAKAEARKAAPVDEPQDVDAPPDEDGAEKE